MKIILVSFADRRYRRAMERIRQETAAFPFAARYLYDERTVLSPAFWRRLRPWLYRRGYGYMSWKSRIVLQVLERADDGDVVFWSDVGNYWNATPEALQRFGQYVAMAQTEGLLTFSDLYPEYQWTKGDVLQACGVYDNDEVCQSPQLLSGAFAVCKSADTVAFVRRWAELCDVGKELITDRRSSVQNKPGFVENRHDQSLFSCLAKQRRHAVVPAAETHAIARPWDALHDCPIQARRTKLDGRPLTEVIWNKLLHPYRTLLYYYFTRVRHYHFSLTFYPW